MVRWGVSAWKQDRTCFPQSNGYLLRDRSHLRDMTPLSTIDGFLALLTELPPLRQRGSAWGRLLSAVLPTDARARKRRGGRLSALYGPAAPSHPRSTGAVWSTHRRARGGRRDLGLTWSCARRGRDPPSRRREVGGVSRELCGHAMLHESDLHYLAGTAPSVARRWSRVAACRDRLQCLRTPPELEPVDLVDVAALNRRCGSA